MRLFDLADLNVVVGLELCEVFLNLLVLVSLDFDAIVGEGFHELREIKRVMSVKLR